MDIPIDFNEYKFDPTPYTHSISMLAKKIEDGNFEANKCSMSTLNQIDALIAEKNEECSRVSEEIKNVRNENVKLQMELDSLKKEEEELSSAHNDLKEALKSVCKVTFVQDNEHFRAITQKIQKSLGFKLKLLQSQDNQHLWTATFLYEANESESNHYVNVLYNNETSTFTLRDMRPKPKRFAEMVNFLAQTNDITGLLYNCWKFFRVTQPQNIESITID